MLKQYKTKDFERCFCQYLKNNITDIRLIPLDHVTHIQLIPQIFSLKELAEKNKYIISISRGTLVIFKIEK